MTKKFRQPKTSVSVNISRYAIILKKQWPVIGAIFGTTVTLSLLGATALKPTYETTGKLLFKPSASQLIDNHILKDIKASALTDDLRSLIIKQNSPQTQKEVISSPALLQQVIDKLQLKNEKYQPLEISTLKDKLRLHIIDGTDILEISYQSSEPKQTAALVNTLMKLYLENDLLTSRAEAQANRQFITNQLPKLQANVNQAEAALKTFRQKNNITDLSGETQTSLGIVGNIDNEINAVKAQLAEVNAQAIELRQKLGLSSQEAIAVSALSQATAVQGTLLQIQDIERQLANAGSVLQDENPVIVTLKAKKANLAKLLQQQIQQASGQQQQFPTKLLQISELQQNLIQDLLRTELQTLGLNKRLNSLYNSRAVYEKRMKTIPQLTQTQNELERNLEISQSIYQTLLKKVEELQLTETQNTANARIIAQALVPQKQQLAPKLLFLLVGTLVGAFLSISTALLLEMRDKSLKTLKEVREEFAYSLLGVIPLSTINTELTTPEVAVRDKPQSLTSEIYRMIQASLKFLSSDKVLKTIVVTSAVPKEGKSTVSANLAAAIAELGRRVLLIDADMRVPSQHHLWQLTNAVGLSEVLVGESEFELAVNRVTEHLHILSAGVRPPNPLVLLDSKRMASLIEDFAAEYDYVIIDTPPALIAADALTLGKMADGILLVARPGIIDSTSALAVREMLENTHHNLLGMVVNGIINKNEPNNYFYHASEYFNEQDSATDAGSSTTNRWKIKISRK